MDKLGKRRGQALAKPCAKRLFVAQPKWGDCAATPALDPLLEPTATYFLYHQRIQLVMWFHHNRKREQVMEYPYRQGYWEKEKWDGEPVAKEMNLTRNWSIRRELKVAG